MKVESIRAERWRRTASARSRDGAQLRRADARLGAFGIGWSAGLNGPPPDGRGPAAAEVTAAVVPGTGNGPKAVGPGPVMVPPAVTLGAGMVPATEGQGVVVMPSTVMLGRLGAGTDSEPVVAGLGVVSPKATLASRIAPA